MYLNQDGFRYLPYDRDPSRLKTKKMRLKNN